MRLYFPVTILFLGLVFSPIVRGQTTRGDVAIELKRNSATWEKHQKTGVTALRHGHVTKAEQALKRAVQLAEKFTKVNPKDPRLASSLLTLAKVQVLKGAFGKADRLSKRAQSLLEKIHDKEHVKVADCLHLRADVYRLLGLRTHAVKLARAGMAIRKKKFGQNHIALAGSIELLAKLGSAGEETAEGKFLVWVGFSLEESCLKVREKAQGKDHPSLANVLLTMAQRESEYAVAEHFVQRALRITKKAYSAKHPQLASCYHTLASVYLVHGKYTPAEAAQAKALSLWSRLGLSQRRSFGLLNLGYIRLGQGRGKEAEQRIHEAIRVYFSKVSDKELCDYFDRLDSTDETTFNYRGFQRMPHSEIYLTEMIRRGGPVIARYLKEKQKEVLQRQRQLKRKPLDFIFMPRNLEILTALRRVQKKDDPLQIVVTGPHYREAIYPLLPHFAVSLANCDPKETPIRITAGGNYRSGRQARWRFDVRDANGNPVPVRPCLSSIGGGIYSEDLLNWDKTWNTVLDMNSFMELPPGDYTVRILYHDAVTIADLDTVAGLIVCRSEPIRLHIQPRVITVTKKDKQLARAALASLNDKAEVKVLEGAYGKHAHKFIDPKSAQGQLLTLGWKALPILFEELKAKNLTPHRRAWVLALLYSITGKHNPRPEEGVLGDYADSGSGFSVWGGFGGSLNSGGMGFTEGGRHKGKIHVARQRAFAERWASYRQYIVIRDGK